MPVLPCASLLIQPPSVPVPLLLQLLQIHSRKSAFVVKHDQLVATYQTIDGCAFQKKKSIKDLGVLIGHVLSVKAFAAPLAEAFRRAKQASYLELTIKEPMILLKTWILPLSLVTAVPMLLSKPPRPLSPMFTMCYFRLIPGVSHCICLKPGSMGATHYL